MSDQPISIHYQQMEEWLEDRKSVFSRKYKKPYAELLTLAPRLVQMAQYDIPALEKQIKKNETAVEECHRVGEEAARTQHKLAEKRAALLAEYGVDVGSSAEGSVLAAVDRRISEACRSTNAAYQHFAATHAGAVKAYYNALLERTAAGTFGSDAFALHFPWLQRAIDESTFALADNTGDATAADGSDGDAGPQIDWGDDTEDFAGAAAGAAVQINWDGDETAAHADEAVDELPPADGKHFSIDLALARHRVNVLAELQAVLCFCRERSHVSPVSASEATAEVYELLSSSRDAEFARMRENFRSKDAFVDRVDRFEQQMMVAKNRHATHEAKMRDAEAELATLQPQHAELLAKTRATRDSALACLGEMFPDRRILIVGDLNKYIS